MRLNRQILHLAIPNIISNLSVPLLSSVDTALVGHLPQIHFIGAVAIGSMIFSFIYWGFGFLRMGTTGLTAQAFGSSDDGECSLILTRSMMVALGGSAILLLLQLPIARLSFYLVQASGDVERYAHQYYSIRIFAAPATLSLYAIQGWFLGMQNARYPLILTVAINLLNIILNVYFIRVLDMNSNGVALGTVFSQYAGLALSVWLFRRSYRHLWQKPDWVRVFNLAALRRFFMLNSDIFIRTLCLIFVFSFFTAKSAEFGDDILAANTILMQLWMIFSYGIDGFAFAAESLVGKYTGAGDRRMLKKVIRNIFAWGVGLGLLFTFGFAFFDHALISVFTGKEVIINLSLSFMVWTIIAPLINSISYLWDGVYIGATASAAMRNAMLVSTLLVFFPAFYWLKPMWGNHGMWLALTLFMVARGLSLTLTAKKHIFNLPFNDSQ